MSKLLFKEVAVPAVEEHPQKAEVVSGGDISGGSDLGGRCGMRETDSSEIFRKQNEADPMMD